MRVNARPVDTNTANTTNATTEREARPQTTPETSTPETPAAQTPARPEWGPTHFVGKSSAVAPVAAPAAQSPRDVVDAFYGAFSRKDGRAMSEAYAPNARFSDAVFPKLDGKEAGAMWRMLNRSPDLRVRHEILKVEGDVVTAKWIANYSAPGTGRPVENHVTATLTVKDGKIVEHRDSFDMKGWVAQAYGPVAKLPFATSALAALTRHFAGRQLRSFIADGN